MAGISESGDFIQKAQKDSRWYCSNPYSRNQYLGQPCSKITNSQPESFQPHEQSSPLRPLPWDVSSHQQVHPNHQMINMVVKNIVDYVDDQVFSNVSSTRMQGKKDDGIQPRTDYQVDQFQNNVEKFVQHKAVNQHIQRALGTFASNATTCSHVTTNQVSLPTQIANHISLPQQITSTQQAYNTHGHHDQMNPVLPQKAHNILPQFNNFISNENQPSHYRLSGPRSNHYAINHSKSFDSCLNFRPNLGPLNNLDSLESNLNNQQHNNSISFGLYGNHQIENRFMQLAANPCQIENFNMPVFNANPCVNSNPRPLGSGLGPFPVNSSLSQAYSATQTEINISQSFEQSRNPYQMSSFPTSVSGMRGHDNMAYSHGHSIAGQDRMLQGSNYPKIPPTQVRNHVEATCHIVPFKDHGVNSSKHSVPVSSDQFSQHASQPPEVVVPNSQALSDNLTMLKWYKMPSEAMSSENTKVHSNNDNLQNVKLVSDTVSPSDHFGRAIELQNSSSVLHEQCVFVPSAVLRSSETLLKTDRKDGSSLLESADPSHCVTSTSSCQSVSDSSNSNVSIHVPHKLVDDGQSKNAIFPNLGTTLNTVGENHSQIDFDNRADEARANSNEGCKSTISPPLSAVEGERLQETYKVPNSKVSSDVLRSLNSRDKSPIGGALSNDDLPLPVIKYVPRKLTALSVYQTPDGHGMADKSAPNVKACKVSHGMAKLRNTSKRHFNDITGNVDTVSTRHKSNSNDAKKRHSSGGSVETFMTSYSEENCKSDLHGAEKKMKKCTNNSPTKWNKHKGKKITRKSDCLLKVKLTFQNGNNRKRPKSDKSEMDISKPFSSTKKRHHSNFGRAISESSDRMKKRCHSDLSNSTKKRHNNYLATHISQSSSGTKKTSSKTKNLKPNAEDKSKLCSKSSNSRFKHSDKTTFLHKQTSPKKYHLGHNEDVSHKHSNAERKSSKENRAKSNKYSDTKKKLKTLPKSQSVERKSSSKRMHSSNKTSSEKSNDVEKHCKSTKEKKIQVGVPKSSSCRVMNDHDCCSLGYDRMMTFPGHKEIDVVCYHGSKLLRLNLPNGRYFVMKEFVSKCFTTKSNKIYQIKTKVLHLQHTELQHSCRSEVIRYLLEVNREHPIKGFSKMAMKEAEVTGRIFLGIILVKDANKLYHYLNSARNETDDEKHCKLTKVKNGNASQLEKKNAEVLESNNTSIEKGGDKSISTCDDQDVIDLNPDKFAGHRDGRNLASISLDDNDIDDENSSVSSDCTVLYADGVAIDTNRNSNDLLDETHVSENEKQLSTNTCKQVVDVLECSSKSAASTCISKNLTVKAGGVELMHGIPLRYLVKSKTKWYLIEDLYPVFGEQEVLTLVQRESITLECCTEEQCQYFRGSASHRDDACYLVNEESFRLISSSIKQRSSNIGAHSTNNQCGEPEVFARSPSRHEVIEIPCDSQDHSNDGLSETCDSLSGNNDSLGTCNESPEMSVSSSLGTSDALTETCDVLSRPCSALSGTCVDSFDVHNDLSGTCDDLSQKHDSAVICDSFSLSSECLSGTRSDSSRIEHDSSTKIVGCSNHDSTIITNQDDHTCTPCDKNVEETDNHDHFKTQELYAKECVLQNKKNTKILNDPKEFQNESPTPKSPSQIDSTVCTSLDCETEPLRIYEESPDSPDAITKLPKGNSDRLILDSKNEQVETSPQMGLSVEGMVLESSLSQVNSDSNLTGSSVNCSAVVSSSTSSGVVNTLEPHSPQTTEDTKISDPSSSCNLAEKMELVSETLLGSTRESLLSSVLYLCEKVNHLQNKNKSLTSEVTRLTTLNLDLQEGVEHYKNMVNEFAMSFKDADED